MFSIRLLIFLIKYTARAFTLSRVRSVVYEEHTVVINVIIALHSIVRPSRYTYEALHNPYKGVGELRTWSTSFPTALTS